ncbi:MAG TPA: pilus assembly protein TadG-related protein [Gaiellaceae bacterium]|nr:pilus assembly protein TadG-related protein [Gaiellaceae bacterium]
MSRRRLHDESGQAMVLVAIALVALLGAAALTVDVGYAYFTQRSLQASADASALAGAQGLPNAVTATSLANQYSGSAGGKNAQGNVPGVVTSVSTKCVAAGVCGSPNAVVVKETAHLNTFFGRVLGINVFDISARATACSGQSGTYLIDDASTSCGIVVGPCTLGYPYVSANPRTSTIFNESPVLRAFAPQIAGPNDTIKVWYNDEHALTLGVRRVVVKTKSGSTTTNYPVSALTSVPAAAYNPAVGTTDLTGDAAGVDPSNRPLFPALFMTDITNAPTSTAGDWQFYGTAIPPDAVFGTWKAAVRTVDKTVSPAAISSTPDADPARNNWTLGGGSDAVPTGLSNEGFGAEARWTVAGLGLTPGHAYRMQFMVHDGDQLKVGGDAGEACMTVVLPH